MKKKRDEEIKKNMKAVFLFLITGFVFLGVGLFILNINLNPDWSSI